MALHIQLTICQIILYLLKVIKLHFQSKISLSSVLSVPSPFNRYSYFYTFHITAEEGITLPLNGLNIPSP